MIRTLTTLAACLSLFAQTATAEPENLPRPNWSRTDSALAIDDAATRETLRGLYRLAREGRSAELLQQVDLIAGGSDRTGPERDFILYSLAVALGDMGPGYVTAGVLEHLADTRALALVPHEENRAMGVPLYNIRAAAAGALAQWRRYEVQAEPATRTDSDQLIAELKHGGRQVTAERIRRAEAELTPAEFESVVAAVPAMPSAAEASMVLGAIAPATVTRPAVTDQLFELLGHRELGGAAALALARSGDESILVRLAELAGDGKGLAAGRASLAIDVYLAAERER